MHGARTARAALLGGCLLGLGMPGSAAATPLVDLVFTHQDGVPIPGTSSVVAAPGTMLTLRIDVSAGPEGLSAYGLSILFDSDLGDELDLDGPDAAIERLPSGFDFQITEGVGDTRESDASQGGAVLTYEAGTFLAGPASARFTIGELRFVVTQNVATDGPDIFAGLFNPGVDGLLDNAGGDLGPLATFGSASVNVPEPSSLLLGVLGLTGLGIRRRYWG